MTEDKRLFLKVQKQFFREDVRELDGRDLLNYHDSELLKYAEGKKDTRWKLQYLHKEILRRLK